MSKPLESTPGAADTAALPSPDRDAIAAEQDAAWDDTATDVGGGDVETDGASTAATPASEESDPNVITDKTALSGAVPAPKPGTKATGAVKPEDNPASASTQKTDAQKAEEAAAASASASVQTTAQKSAAYWDKVTSLFPSAAAVTQTPKFLAWLESLPPADRAAAADLDKPDDAVRILGRYYDDVERGKVKEPEPPAPPKPFDLSDHVSGRKLSDVKVKLPDGTETTLGEMSKPEQYGEVLSAVGAMVGASEQAMAQHVSATIQSLVERGVLVTGQQFQQLLDRLGDKELAGKVPDAPAVTSTPEFQEYVGRSKLLQAAWASRDAEQRAEVVAMFKADQARADVSGAAATQRRTAAAKAGLHRGTLHSGAAPAKPGAADDTPAAQQDAAWDTPIDVEGQKV